MTLTIKPFSSSGYLFRYTSSSEEDRSTATVWFEHGWVKTFTFDTIRQIFYIYSSRTASVAEDVRNFKEWDLCSCNLTVMNELLVRSVYYECNGRSLQFNLVHIWCHVILVYLYTCRFIKTGIMDIGKCISRHGPVIPLRELLSDVVMHTSVYAWDLEI